MSKIVCDANNIADNYAAGMIRSSTRVYDMKSAIGVSLDGVLLFP